MSTLPQINIAIDPNGEDIVDREIIRELTEGASLEKIAEDLKRDEATIKRRMGTLLIRLIVERVKA